MIRILGICTLMIFFQSLPVMAGESPSSSKPQNFLQMIDSLPKNLPDSDPLKIDVKPVAFDSKLAELDYMVTRRSFGSLEDWKPSGSQDEKAMMVQRLVIARMLAVAPGGSFGDNLESDLAWAQKQGLPHPYAQDLRELAGNLQGKSLEQQMTLVRQSRLPDDLQRTFTGAILDAYPGLQALEYLERHPQILLPEEKARLIGRFIGKDDVLKNLNAQTLDKLKKAYSALDFENRHSRCQAVSQSVRLLEIKPNTRLQHEYGKTVSKGLLAMKSKTDCQGYISDQMLRQLFDQTEKLRITPPGYFRTLGDQSGASYELAATNFQQCQIDQIFYPQIAQEIKRYKSRETQDMVLAATSTAKCNLHVFGSRTPKGYQIKISLWNSRGQSLLKIDRHFEANEMDLLKDILLTGRFPEPAKDQPLSSNSSQRQRPSRGIR